MLPLPAGGDQLFVREMLTNDEKKRQDWGYNGIINRMIFKSLKISSKPYLCRNSASNAHTPGVVILILHNES